MFTDDEKKWFVIAACGQWIEGCSLEEDDNGVVIVTEPSGKIHEVRPICPECGDATGTCDCWE